MAGTRKKMQGEEEMKAWLLNVAQTAGRFADGIDPKRKGVALRGELKRLIVLRLDAIQGSATYAHTLLTM